MTFQIILFVLCTILRNSFCITQPDELENLLNTKQYEEFAKLTRFSEGLVTPAANVDSNFLFAFYIQGYGDMMLLPEQRKIVEGSNDSHANGFLFGKWNKVVPYAIIPTNYTSEEISRIEEGIRSWNYRFLGVIKVRPQTPDDEDYVAIFNGNGCFSHVGRLGGLQAISMGQGGNCFSSGTVHHELMHTIGMMHLNNRLDRDLYIRPIPERIPDGLHGLFMDTIPDLSTVDPSKLYVEIEVPYDYDSLMLVEPYLVAGEGEPIYDILRSDRDPAKIETLGLRDLSYFDEMNVRNFYRDT